MIIFTIAIVMIVLGTAFLSYLATKSLLERETTLLKQKMERLEERHLYLEMEHPTLGKQKFQAPPFQLSGSPAVIDRVAPLLGQHTREVLQELLDMDLDDIRAGYKDGTFWPSQMPTYPYVEEALQ